ncbi:MAG: type III pantothenate kinase [Flavobacteriales bacterium]|nr:type III pantothenate kinase [Flavobacteriales bacterium]
MTTDLVLDVGNTRTKLGLFPGGKLLEHGHIANGDLVALRAFVAGRRVDAIVTGSTAAADARFMEALGTIAPTVTITGASPSPLRNAYGTQHTLGADRLANAVGALCRFPGRAVLAIDLGTCLTYDLCLPDGTYAGGGISPGLRMRAQAMHTYSARLPLVEPGERPALVGTTTEESLAAGIHYGILGELEGHVRRFRNEHAHLAVVLTGGDALRFVRGLESGIFALPHLTLEGYHALLQHHRTLHRAAGAAGSGAIGGTGAAG